MPKSNDENATPPATALQAMRPVVIVGATIVLVFFVGFGGWAATAPLQSAAVAPGVLSVESYRKTVQHLEGGIVAKILVQEGQSVSAGQTLIQLDTTQVKANLAQLRIRHEAVRALAARLEAERDGRDEIDFADQNTSKDVSNAIKGELNIFNARRRALAGEQGILENRITQFREEMTGLHGQINAQGTQLKLIDEELAAQEKLFARKLTGMQRIIELKRERSEVSGNRSQQRAAIARIKQSIEEEKLKILELRTTILNEVVAQLREVKTSFSDLDERIHAAEDVLHRTNITAPLNGTIVNLQVHTIGGVIGAGESLMDIVPDEEELVVEARVNPIDIDSVVPGMEAEVVLTAFNRRTVAPLTGVVASVSADRLTDERTGNPYYLARVTLPDIAVTIEKELELSAGMQAEVMIITGEQTTVEYIFRPVQRSFYRAMREQ